MKNFDGIFCLSVCLKNVGFVYLNEKIFFVILTWFCAWSLMCFKSRVSRQSLFSEKKNDVFRFDRIHFAHLPSEIRRLRNQLLLLYTFICLVQLFSCTFSTHTQQTRVHATNQYIYISFCGAAITYNLTNSLYVFIRVMCAHKLPFDFLCIGRYDNSFECHIHTSIFRYCFIKFKLV